MHLRNALKLFLQHLLEFHILPFFSSKANVRVVKLWKLLLNVRNTEICSSEALNFQTVRALMPGN